MSDCIHCDKWGCRRCLPTGGEQGPSVEDLRESRLLARVASLEKDAAEYETELGVYRKALERIEKYCSYVRDGSDPLAQVGLIAVGALTEVAGG